MSAAAVVALGYEPRAADGRDGGRIHIDAGGSHVLPVASESFKAALLAAVLELAPRGDAQVVVLGAEVGALSGAARAALRTQVAYLPANGGLISHLNGWENIALPLGFHDPKQLGRAPRLVAELLEQFGADPRVLLATLPEDMTAFERALTGYVRMRLGRPSLVLAEDPGGSLAAGERRRAANFASAYLADCPQGTFVQLQDAPDESG